EAPGSTSSSDSRSLKSLDSATTLVLGSQSRESLEDSSDREELPNAKGIEVEDTLVKTVQEDPVPEDKPSRVVPQDKPSTVVPEDKPSTVVPEDKPSTVVPEDKPSTVVPEDKPSTAVPEDKPSTAVPEDKPSTVVPEPSTVVREDKPANTVVPEDKPSTTAVPEDKPSTEVPNKPVPARVAQPNGPDMAAGGGSAVQVKQEQQDEADVDIDDKWRRDKYGALLSPAALYARFYRKDRNHRMHEMYMQYLSCRAEWTKSFIVVSVRSKKSEEIYAWKTLKVLRAELGDALANDLFARHMEVDPRMTGKLLQPHPNFPKEMTLLKSFDTIKDISAKKFSTSAGFHMEAENVDEEDMHGAMWLVVLNIYTLD
ncbi:Ogfr, partial [Symbiodinium necroappetens]